jgi:hypothetical protein
MRRLTLLLVGTALLCAALPFSRKTNWFKLLRSTAMPGKQPDGSWLVATQQLIRPWGEVTRIPGRPVDLSFDSTRSVLAVLNNSAIEFLNGSTGTLIDHFKTKTTSYCGIAFRPGDREIWARETTGKGDDTIFIGKLNQTRHITGLERIHLPGHVIPAGIAFSPDGRWAYVAFNQTNTVAVFDAVPQRGATDSCGPCTLQRSVRQRGEPLYVPIEADGLREPERQKASVPESAWRLTRRAVPFWRERSASSPCRPAASRTS